MKLAIFAGPATTGKTSVIRHVLRKLPALGRRAAYLKIDVQYAEEDRQIAAEFGIPVKKIYSGELCPDHCGVMVLSDALKWAKKEGRDTLIIETAGLCLRCSPYVDGGLGVVVLEATSGMNLPRKIGPMLTLADIAVITKIDLISQAEREVFRARVMDAAPNVEIREANSLHGTGTEPLARKIASFPDAGPGMALRGNPPVGTCTICAGKKEIGWENHFGVVRQLENQTFYRGE